jgi:hypothetical protein
MAEPFDIKKFFMGFFTPSTWAKTVVFMVIGGMIFFMLTCVKNFFFPKPRDMVNKPVTVVLPFAKVEKGAVDQSNTQISLDEKLNEAGIFAGGLNYDNKNGVFVGVGYKRKF